MALRNRGDGPHVETAPSDEGRNIPAGAPAPLIMRTPDGRVTDAASAAALGKMRSASPGFVSRAIKCDPAFEVHNRRRVLWDRKRRAEFIQNTGGCSHAVTALVRAAGWAYAAAEFAAERAALTADLELFKVAATFTEKARQHDLAAFEIATREAKARPAREIDWSTPPTPIEDEDDDEADETETETKETTDADE